MGAVSSVMDAVTGVVDSAVETFIDPVIDNVVDPIMENVVDPVVDFASPVLERVAPMVIGGMIAGPAGLGLSGAAAGATAGAIGSAISGGDPLRGAAFGGLGGGLFGNFGGGEPFDSLAPVDEWGSMNDYGIGAGVKDTGSWMPDFGSPAVPAATAADMTGFRTPYDPFASAHPAPLGSGTAIVTPGFVGTDVMNAQPATLNTLVGQSTGALDWYGNATSPLIPGLNSLYDFGTGEYVPAVVGNNGNLNFVQSLPTDGAAWSAYDKLKSEVTKKATEAVKGSAPAVGTGVAGATGSTAYYVPKTGSTLNWIPMEDQSGEAAQAAALAAAQSARPVT